MCHQNLSIPDTLIFIPNHPAEIMYGVFTIQDKGGFNGKINQITESLCEATFNHHQWQIGECFKKVHFHFNQQELCTKYIIWQPENTLFAIDLYFFNEQNLLTEKIQTHINPNEWWHCSQHIYIYDNNGNCIQHDCFTIFNQVDDLLNKYFDENGTLRDENGLEFELNRQFFYTETINYDKNNYMTESQIHVFNQDKHHLIWENDEHGCTLAHYYYKNGQLIRQTHDDCLYLSHQDLYQDETNQSATPCVNPYQKFYENSKLYDIYGNMVCVCWEDFGSDDCQGGVFEGLVRQFHYAPTAA